MNKLKVYLASRYGKREELAQYKDQLEAIGVQITARWLNGNHQITDEQLNTIDPSLKLDEGDCTAETVSDLRKRFAVEDWDDLMEADAVICFTEPPRTTASRGGRHVEFGAALAAGKVVFVVGFLENIFYCMDNVYFFKTWDDVLKHFTGLMKYHKIWYGKKS